ncbi:MAG TPA: chemotaxis protein CheW [Dissulfurispiraceae bacterium]|nr:chemotaxis protein CheW [Dissulfurispiraceae bacterium]
MDSGRLKSDRILEQLKKRSVREKVVDVEEEKVKLVIFSLADEYYAFNGSEVKEILLPPDDISYVPGTPGYVLGVINVRGDIESVVAINTFLALPESKKTSRSRIAIAVKGGVRSGIMVDSIEDVLDVPVSGIRPPLSTLDAFKKECVTGELIFKGKNVTILDTGKIFGRLAV